MRGSVLQNSIKTAIPAHLWPFKVDGNCDALSERPAAFVVCPSTQVALRFCIAIP
jgi:hypothetical protein